MEKTNIFGNSKNNYNYEQFLDLLKELNDILKEQDEVVTLSVYGGFVLCSFGIRYMTEDIDAVYIQSEKIVENAVKSIAIKNKISENWLNSSIKEIVLEDMKKEELTNLAGSFTNIVINMPSCKQMLAMKLYSARLSKDLEDAVELARLLGITNEHQLDIILKDFFKLDSVRGRNSSNKNIIGRFKAEVASKIIKEGEN